MLNKKLVKIFLVLILLIGPITQWPVFTPDNLIVGTTLIAMVLIPIAILRKWYLNIKKRKTNKTLLNNAPEKITITEDISLMSQKEITSLIFINIIFIIFSVINGLVVTDLASLRGSARGQGEFIYFIIFPIYIILATISTIISYRNLHKQYIFRGWLAVVLLPVFAFFLEEKWGIYLLDFGLNNFLIIFLITIVTAFIFFSPALAQLFKVLKPNDKTQ